MNQSYTKLQLFINQTGWRFFNTRILVTIQYELMWILKWWFIKIYFSLKFCFISEMFVQKNWDDRNNFVYIFGKCTRKYNSISVIECFKDMSVHIQFFQDLNNCIFQCSSRKNIFRDNLCTWIWCVIKLCCPYDNFNTKSIRALRM